MLRFCTFMLLILMLCGAMEQSVSQTRTGKSTISGIVTDSLTRAPLFNANVFLQNTTRGGSTSDEGRYILRNIPSGEYQIVFSLIGYERVVKQITVTDSTTVLVNAVLTPREIRTEAVDVVASYEEKWRDYLPRFKAELFGNSRHFDRCSILNPEVILFSTDPSGMVLNARTDSSLILENYGLGYRITMHLERFLSDFRSGRFEMIGYAFFQELPARDEQQAEEWLENRFKSYRASLRYFLSNLVKRMLSKTGYLLTRGTLQELIKAKGEELEEEAISVQRNPRTGYSTINFNTPFVRIDPQRRLGDWPSSLSNVTDLNVRPEPQRDLTQEALDSRLPPPRGARIRDLSRSEPMTFQRESIPVTVGVKVPGSVAIISIPAGSFVVDECGDVLRPRSITLRGWWANRRLADELPKDYSPVLEH